MSTATEYRELLVEFAPHPIRSDADYRRAVEQLGRIMEPRPSPARSQLIEVLATLIERYESRDYPTPDRRPVDMLKSLLQSRRITPAVLAKATGIPTSTISNVLAGRRGISKANAVALGAHFGVSASVFLDSPDSPRAKR
ncbi:MAG: type II toxin-antitoxin system HigA family antitoxin [Planctomycetia bacterium]